MPKQIISASEMERYGYCPLSWYLDSKGVDAEGKEVDSGLEKHKEIGVPCQEKRPFFNFRRRWQDRKRVGLGKRVERAWRGII